MTTAAITLERTLSAETATLTLVPLDHSSMRTVSSWTDQQEVHHAVMKLFPETLPGEPAQRRATSAILHRHDIPTGRPARLLIQHAVPLRPEHTHDADLPHVDLTPLLAHLRPGQPVRFRIVLNPVRCKSRSNTRMPITDPDDLVQWGIDKLHANGLRQVTLSVRPRTAVLSAKAPLWTAQYDGHALIADPDTAKKAVLNGIGRSKAYGCGLLSLAPTQI